MKTLFDTIITMSLNEDAPFGDITTNGTVPADARVSGRFIAKDDGVLCGIDIAERTFALVGDGVEIKKFFQDGDNIKKGDVIAEINGNARTILTGERTALNLMQRASGIATQTAEAVKSVKGTKALIADTRKTMPGLRLLDKYAVRVGGGSNHRFNLSDGILIKDNHISAAGSITNAVLAARRNSPHTLKIEVEVENFEQLEEALAVKADIIMLDNMSNSDMKKAVQIINGRAIIEASGNMGEKNLAEVASTGIDLISIGALTHSVKALDISLKFKIL